MSGKYTVGIDLGGTKILAIVVTPGLKVISRSKCKTKSELGIDGTGRGMKAAAGDALKEAGLAWKDVGDVGIAVPTPVDPKTGDALHSPALGWRNQPLRKKFRDIFRKPIYLENDVNCGTLAEFRCGAAKGYRHVVGYFVGTGLGGGIVINGRLHTGIRGSAGELGHEIVEYNGRKCGCGKLGCVEAYCSKTAFCRQFHKLIVVDKEKSLLSEYDDNGFKGIKSGVLLKCYREGDKITRKVVNKGFYMLGLAAANQASIIAPECIVFGGGVMEAFQKSAMPFIRKGFEENLFALSPDDLRLKLSKLGDDAVPMGAAILAMEKGVV
jgi:glucokinase